MSFCFLAVTQCDQLPHAPVTVATAILPPYFPHHDRVLKCELGDARVIIPYSSLSSPPSQPTSEIPLLQGKDRRSQGHLTVILNFSIPRRNIPKQLEATGATSHMTDTSVPSQLLGIQKQSDFKYI